MPAGEQALGRQHGLASLGIRQVVEGCPVHLGINRIQEKAKAVLDSPRMRGSAWTAVAQPIVMNPMSAMARQHPLTAKSPQICLMPRGIAITSGQTNVHPRSSQRGSVARCRAGVAADLPLRARLPAHRTRPRPKEGQRSTPRVAISWHRDVPAQGCARLPAKVRHQAGRARPAPGHQIVGASPRLPGACGGWGNGRVPTAPSTQQQARQTVSSTGPHAPGWRGAVAGEAEDAGRRANKAPRCRSDSPRAQRRWRRAPGRGHGPAHRRAPSGPPGPGRAARQRPQPIGDRMPRPGRRGQRHGLAPPLPAYFGHRRLTRHRRCNPGEFGRKSRQPSKSPRAAPGASKAAR